MWIYRYATIACQQVWRWYWVSKYLPPLTAAIAAGCVATGATVGGIRVLAPLVLPRVEQQLAPPIPLPYWPDYPYTSASSIQLRQTQLPQLSSDQALDIVIAAPPMSVAFGLAVILVIGLRRYHSNTRGSSAMM